MRRPLLLLVLLALGTSACGGSAATAAPANGGPVERPLWTQPPRQAPASEAPATAAPAGTPYDGVTYTDPGVNPFVPTDRDREPARVAAARLGRYPSCSIASTTARRRSLLTCWEP